MWQLSVWVHILAACAWIGGMAFLVVVVVPWLRRGDRARALQFLLETGERFRAMAWVCLGLLAITGTYNLSVRGVTLEALASPELRQSIFGVAALAKLGVFALIVLVSAYHDFHVGPRATEALARDPSSTEAETLRRRASLLGRLNALLALVMVAIAVVLVRGW